VISAAENSNKFQKARFWKEKSVEDVVFAHISNLLHGLHIRSILPFNSPCAFFSTFRSVMYGVVCPINIGMLGQKAMNVHQCFLSLWSKASGLWLSSRETDYHRLRRSKMP
jgi:hypothetical protein